MGNYKQFSSLEFGLIRTVTINNEPYFVGKDIACALGYSNPSKVLPDIRKTGMYATDEILNNPDLLIQVATQLKEERQARQQLELINQENQPKVLFADSVASSKQTILIGDLAKLIKQNGYDIGQNRLFEWLRSNGYLISRNGESYNLPTQRAMDLELFEVKERTHLNPDGSVRLTKTTKVTGKGQVYFINKFLQN